MKELTKQKMWCFAVGQFGWSLLSALITNWLVYFYQPTDDLIAEGHPLLIPQGTVILGFFTILGGIAALGRLFDAVSDPIIANLSDRSKNPKGRRIPFMRRIAFPFALVTVFVFQTPVNGVSSLNSIWLLVTLLLFYLFMTIYCTPYNALISELGRTQDIRISISTYISCTFLLGSAVGYAAPYLWNALSGVTDSRITAMRITFLILSVIGCIALLVPTFTIREKDYVTTVPSEDDAFTSLKKTFRNSSFRIFVVSDVLYFVALTIFQTGLPFFVTKLMDLPETNNTTLYIMMTLLSFACYPLVNGLAHRFHKKKLVLAGFVGLSITYLITAFSGMLGISGSSGGLIGSIFGNAWGILIVVSAAFPMAILGILPQAIVADIAQADAVETSENREGMFFAARTFAFKVGQSLSMLIFTSIASIHPETGVGYRITAIVATTLCLTGGLVLSAYKEKEVLQKINP